MERGDNPVRPLPCCLGDKVLAAVGGGCVIAAVSGSRLTLNSHCIAREEMQPVKAMKFYIDMLLSPVIPCFWMVHLLTADELKKQGMDYYFHKPLPDSDTEDGGEEVEPIAGRSHRVFARRVLEQEYDANEQQSINTYHMRHTDGWAWHNARSFKDDCSKLLSSTESSDEEVEPTVEDNEIAREDMPTHGSSDNEEPLKLKRKCVNM